jgi:hypothetical protein
VRGPGESYSDASYQYALTLYVVKECPLLWAADVPEAEIIFVNQHLTAPTRVGWRY